MTVVDVHTHMIPPSLVETIAGGDGPDGIGVEEQGGIPQLVYADGRRYPVRPIFGDVAAKLEQMDGDGIDVSVVSLPSTHLPYWLDPKETARLCRVINDGMSALSAAAPGRIYGMASVPMNEPRAAAEELRRARRELGLAGLAIGTSVEEIGLDAEELDPIWRTAVELGTPIFLHPYRSMTKEPPAELADFHLSNVIGNPLETFVAASRLILAGALDRHPELTFQLAHGGGSLPYQLGRLDHAYHAVAGAGAAAAKRPLAYLDHFLFDTVIFEPRALEYLISLVGAERVVFGTDRPFEMADLSGTAIAKTASRCDAERILGANALEALGIEPAVASERVPDRQRSGL
ncbi:MAG: amidohydrolase family protein [Solirubrobacterales bacterium]|nr:amidohydrolase family protein [Solirubrobacterales bacterium]